LKCKFCGEECVYLPLWYGMECGIGMQPWDPTYTALHMYNLKLYVFLHKNYVATSYIAL